MSTRSPLLAVAAAALLVCGAAWSQDAAPADPRSMTPEQREARRAEMRERWDNMSEEERAALREERRAKREARRAEMRERWDNMSEEERAALREERRARRQARHAEMRERWDNMSEEDRAAARHMMKKRRAMHRRGGPRGGQVPGGGRSSDESGGQDRNL